jgi:hypothetical protein
MSHIGGKPSNVTDGLSASAAAHALGALYRHSIGGVNTGTVTNGTAVAVIGSLTAGVGMVPDAACHLTKMTLCYQGANGNVSGTVTARWTLFKNANSGTTNRIFQSTSQAITTGTGYGPFILTSVIDAGMNAFNGTTDYFVLIVEATIATSVSLSQCNVNIIGTYD